MPYRLEVTEQAILDAIEKVCEEYDGDGHPLWVERRCREAVADLLHGEQAPPDEYLGLRIQILGRAKLDAEGNDYTFRIMTEH